MGKLIKFVIYLACLAFLGVVGYAYLGPVLGTDFDAPQEEIRKPVVLNAD